MELLATLDDSTAQVILDEILSQEHLFGQSVRTQYEGSAHMEVWDIILRGPVITEDTTLAEAQADTECVNYPAAEAFPAVMAAIDNFVPESKLGRVLITLLPTMSTIYPHVDEGPVPQQYDRHHYAVTGGDSNIWCSPGEVTNMNAGELWKVDVRQPHAVINMMPYDRIHVVFDVERDDDQLPD